MIIMNFDSVLNRSEYNYVPRRVVFGSHAVRPHVEWAITDYLPLDDALTECQEFVIGA